MTVVPSVTASDRYDSNVFFSPPSSVPSGGTSWDFVTAVATEVKVQQKGRSIEGNLIVGGSLNAYVNNPGLNYFATNTVLGLKLDNLINRLIPRMRLQVDEFFQYTPQPPAFLTPTAVGPGETNLIGIQAFRANSISNVAAATGFYDVSPTLSVKANYLNFYNRFGQAFVTPGATGFFNTFTQTFTVGPEIKLSPLDKASLSYAYATTEYSTFPGFSTNTITAEYTRNLTPALVATMNVGGTQIDPGAIREPVGKAELNWRISEDERWMIRYTRSVTANFFLVAAALVSQRFSAGVIHQVTNSLSMTASANYAHNETTSNPVFLFRTYSVDLGLTYAMTRFISTSLGTSYTNYNYGGTKFNREVVTFSLIAAWP